MQLLATSKLSVLFLLKKPPELLLKITIFNSEFVDWEGFCSGPLIQRPRERAPPLLLSEGAKPSVCCIVYAIIARFRGIFSPSSMPLQTGLMPFLDRSTPKEHVAVNRMPKFELVRILRLVKNGYFWVQEGVLLLLILLLRTTIFTS